MSCYQRQIHPVAGGGFKPGTTELPFPAHKTWALNVSYFLTFCLFYAKANGISSFLLKQDLGCPQHIHELLLHPSFHLSGMTQQLGRAQEHRGSR